jgi:hypothetical protein
MKIDYAFLKKSLIEGDVAAAAEWLHEVYLQHRDNFMKPILLADVLPEPLQRDFEKNIGTIKVFDSACELVHLKLNQSGQETGSFAFQYSSVIKTILDLYVHNKSNTKQLGDAELFKLPIPTIIHMLCVFLENQDRLSSLEQYVKMKESKYIDLFSRGVADIESGNGNISLSTNLEAGFETVSVLFGYLFYKGKKELEREIEKAEDISPYEIPSIEKLNLLALHRGMVDHLWEKVKYRGWRQYLWRGMDEEEIMYYEPPNKKFFKLESAAVERYSYKEKLDLYKRQDLSFRSTFEKLILLEDNLAAEIDLDEPASLFRLNSEKLKQLTHTYHKINETGIDSLEFIDSDIWRRNVLGANRNISFKKFFSFVTYLQALGGGYSQKSHENFVDEDRAGYKRLAPRIQKSALVNNYVELFDEELEVTTELLDMLTFRPRPKGELSDLFSQPLVFMGEDEVVLVPALIKQLNLPRMIEQQFGIWKIDDAYKGKALERYIKRALSFNRFLKVNLGELKFDAFDGKPVEFDFLATFEDHVLLIEMKCLRRPYSPKEIFDLEDDVYYGVEQVNRRAEVLQRDWEQIRASATIGLPTSPPDPKKIIKVVCLNIFDFTAKKIDGVVITDASSLTKYFMNPVVDQIEIGKTKKKVGEFSLWELGKPTPMELKRFLEKPHAMKDIYDCLESTPRQLMLIEEENEKIVFLDFAMTRNPTELIMSKMSPVQQNGVVHKRNHRHDKRATKVKIQNRSRKNNRKR